MHSAAGSFTKLHHFKYFITCKCFSSPIYSSAWSWRNPPTSHPCSMCLQVMINADKNFKILKLAPQSFCRLPPAGTSNSITTEHSWRLSYLSPPSLRILYFSRNSACFCRRISVCFLKPLTLGNIRENTFRPSAIFKH